MSEGSVLKNKVAKGVLWGGLNNGSQQLLNLVIGIFLARILTPEDYGMVGVLAVFSALASALQEGGFISALTNKKNVSQTDYSSVFFFSASCGITFYLLLFFLAPLIARFYEIQELTSLARFIFLGFLFSSINIAPRAILFKNLRVRETAIINILSLAISGFIGIIVAFNGYAYWGLAWQTVCYTFCTTLFTFYFTKWYPRNGFSLTPIKEMLGYSSRLVITNVFNVLNNNIFAVLLGKFYSASDVGDFNQANKWNSMGSSLIWGIIGGVAQPALASVSEDPQRQSNVFRKLLRFTAFISFPTMFCLALVAPDFIVIALGEKWLFSSFILQLLCIWGAFFPISYLFSNLLLSQGRSTAFMWSTITLAVIQMVAVYFSYPYGLFRMIYIFIGINIAWLVVLFCTARKVTPLRWIETLKDTLPFLIISLAAWCVGYFLTRTVDNLWGSLFSKAGIMLTLYILILWITKAKILTESVEYIRHRKTGSNTLVGDEDLQ